MSLTQRTGLPTLRGREALVLAFLVDSLGTGLYLPFSLLYFQKIAGLPLPAIGITLTIATFLTLPITPVTGTLADRWGAKRVLVISQLIQAVGILGCLFVHDIPLLFVTSFLGTIGNRIFFASASALQAEVAEADERDRWFAFIGAIRSLGQMVGGLLAGFMISWGGDTGYRAVILANALSFLLMALLLRWHRSGPCVQPTEQRANADAAPLVGYRTVLADRPYIVFVACNVVFALSTVLLSIGLPIYATEALHVSSAIVGALFSCGSLLVICIQTLMMQILGAYRRTRSLIVACLIAVAGCLLLALAGLISGPLLIPYLFGAVIVYTMAGLISNPIVGAIAAASSRPQVLGRYMALMELSWNLAGAIGPIAFTALYAFGPAWPWVLLVGPLLIVALVIRQLEAHLVPQAIYARTPVLAEEED